MDSEGLWLAVIPCSVPSRYRVIRSVGLTLHIGFAPTGMNYFHNYKVRIILCTEAKSHHPVPRIRALSPSTLLFHLFKMRSLASILTALALAPLSAMAAREVFAHYMVSFLNYSQSVFSRIEANWCSWVLPTDKFSPIGSKTLLLQKLRK